VEINSPVSDFPRAGHYLGSDAEMARKEDSSFIRLKLSGFFHPTMAATL